ncbi:UbiD family decarboxylase [Alteribacillus sp. YIM 98480]|uniref:UbiD family decarboxylase n=1 Tax=Alteribacillus sp. YIM 98480 TaxID=2606599 RepID=UPI00131BB6FC|nr:UbiD family decarboxylase [Alteribacillus sp. YIM 98480]
MKSSFFRNWLEYMASNNNIGIVEKPVSITHEIAAFTKYLDGKNPVLFSNVEGYDIPVVAGIASTREQFADAIGCSLKDMSTKFLDAIDNPVPNQRMNREDAPVQENVVTEDIDLLTMLPIPKFHKKDSGHYITAGLAIVRDPKTGKQNVSIHRLQVSGKNKLGALILPRHTYNFYKYAEERDQPLEIAIVLGVDPILMLASQAIAPLGQDELEIAGAIKGEAVSVVKCTTVDIDVPAYSEIVLEGKILPKVRESEGPFGEFPSYYGPESDKHVITVDAITHRSCPIFQTCLAGSDENLLLGAIPREAGLLRALRNTSPMVKEVHLTRGGKNRFHLVVSMKKRNEGEAKNVIFAAFAGHYDIKQVIIVDEEIDIFNSEQVEWCVATRFQADKDLVVAHGALGSKLDPSTDNGVSAKMGLDCTVPLDADPFDYEVTEIPNMEKIDFEADIQWKAKNKLSSYWKEESMTK